MPDRLAGRAIMLAGDVAADVADAEAALARLDAEVSALFDSEALARLLLRAESVASSRIEGLRIGARRLLRAEAARELGEEPSDVTAIEVLGNIDAMHYAVRNVGVGKDIALQQLLDIHRLLLTEPRVKQYAGHLRDEQNWIGGSAFNPCSAAFVPPPPELVCDLLDDLCAFCNEAALPAVAQAALAHAQFETIHPFADGNGRTGRALIHLVLRRRGLATRVLPPVSLILATHADRYLAGLMATRYRGPANSRAAHEGINLWIAHFAAACTRAAADAGAFEQCARDLEVRWRRLLAPVRANSATDLLLRVLPGAPVLTVSAAARLTNRSFTATNDAVSRLLEAGVLVQIRAGRRNRAFEAPEVIDSFTALERQFASPAGDTRVAPPARAVPRAARSAT
ncbi:MAG: Fic family protein [Solirubrobacterales bacterium]